MNPFELGIVEGFFGDSWSWDARAHYAQTLAGMGYQFYVYAPKDDRFLRREWMSDWPAALFAQLKSFATACRSGGVRFGIGLSPFEAYKDYSPAVRQRLIDKVRLIEQELNPAIFCILFDDMRGDTSDLATMQIRMIDDVANNTTAERIVMCPTYYSTDPVLERVFGKMPDCYLETLGDTLDGRIDMFWTGPRVCSNEYPHEHLEAIAERLRRKPFLWDNYPVNDSKAMSSLLHLRAFTNRPASLSTLLSGHAINPMKQSALSRLPLGTLPLSYAQPATYDAVAAWRAVAKRECGLDLAQLIEQDLPLFQDVGLEKLTAEQRERIASRYTSFDSQPMAQEILGWLRGEYVFDPACLTD